MNRIGLVWLFLVLSVFSIAAQQKYALVIGNGAYRNLGRLKNPVNDANDMTAALRGLGFTVDTLTDAGRVQMEDAVERFKNRLSVSKNSYGFLFYAGHGVQSRGINYLIPVDADIRSESYLGDRAVSVQAMLDEINRAGNGLNIVVLDACRDNPFGWARSGSRGLQVVGSQPADSIIVYATSAGATAADGEGRNGIFTGELLKNLKTPGIDVNEVFRRTGGDVARVSGGMQRPAVYNQFYGLAYLGSQSAAQTAQPAARTVQPAPAPSVTPAAQPARRNVPQDLADVFGARGVTAAFNAVHDFLQTCNSGNAQGRKERITRRIRLGDWIDLPRLTVQGDVGGGAINTDNVDLGKNGKLLRLIVVGIDSFAATNRDAPAHVVFQFQNVPGSRRMNTSYTNAGGYKASEMRRYLTASFLRGLLTAGVPEGVLYAPTRYIANGGPGATAADALADRLWLPTERELFGANKSSNRTWETAANQTRLEYYENNSRRIKYNAEGSEWWWEASPDSGSAQYFCGVNIYGAAFTSFADSVNGFAPAFCVR
ncbi:MAG: caspase family protein [Treponema sp.]|jgi:uncharacterized caspase-like protein|nr:caspase family protein [Treponema sp.]